ncbi:uncharacterized protein LOC127837088 [Dreissena polymorpha]|nr:uncharacterized protein LOC127837088 [Dreissena polymorpha]
MTTQVTLTPWVGGKVWGDAAIDIGFARGGIRLIGYLLETKFPMTTELVFSKYPIDVGAKMDLVLTPLRLELKAFAELFILSKTIKIFEGTIWKYQVPTIHKNIFTKKKRDDDPSPPDVLPATINERRRRAGPEGCIVNQVYNRAYYDTAFTLEMFAQDEVSEVKLTYAIGTHKGGTNVQAWTEMGGNTLLVPAKLPSGVPLHWTVSATNTQGLSSTVQCSLNTYDSTLPDGRVEHPYKYSSHPSKLVAFIIVAEDSPLKEMNYKAVGYSPGQYGNQFVRWEKTRLDLSPLRQGVAGALQHFTTPMDGKLIANVLKTAKPLRFPDLCAEECMNHGSNCVSFSYEYHSETCDLHDQVAGANAYLRISGTYKNYERLGIGYHTSVEYDNLTLTHGTQYFVNAKVTNVLGYVDHLIGEGTMVDFTPPEPGLILNNQSDFLRADQCNASVSQRCLEVTPQENHRIIIDGPDSGTVFNGHQPVQDELYTLKNHYVSANWKGFHDDESGIYAYTWAVGKSVCSSDVVPFTNPYAHLTNPKFWTDSAFQKGIHLPDGPYFVTVQALNGAELGGSLVTTVCHSTPFVVDTSLPVFHKVTDIIYDEDFDLIAIYYNATDDLSKIAHAEFGLGKTKYDVQLKAYGLHAPIEREDPFVAVKDLGLQEGIPAWIRIRVTNNVDLFTAGHGDEPILIDRSPPIPGGVMDGNRLRRDRQFQADDHKICAQWIDFFDPESGIDRFLWGVGTAPQLDDIVKFHNLTRHEKSSCVPATLKHNSTYFSTVLAFNSALNSKPCNSSSDGVLVDTTPPIVGIVLDGIRNATELKYTSETVSKHANWRDYYDPESGIANYKVDVYINNEKKKTFETGTLSEFEDHTISMEHKDEVYFEVHGVNGAELEAAARSDSFIVDHTPPIMTEISDNKDGNRYQADKSKLSLKWDFFDSESGIGKYRTVIYESRHGIKQKHWPASERYNETKPMSTVNDKMDSTLGNLNMEDGVTYSLHVTAFDGALLATAHESTGVLIDTTPPSTPKVKVGLPTEDEEVDQGQVLHNDPYGIRLSWSSRDSESGISKYEVAIGTNDNKEKILPFTDYGTDTTAYISNIFLEPYTNASTNASTLYVVTVKASNGAELVSDMGVSKEIKVQRANIPGVVFDGRSLFEDESFTTDHTSIAASFYGFESESCDIINYDWAIGTTEFGTDILTYTNYGLVMLNDTHGQCQIHTELFEDVTYYITVRAVTGCHEEYIVSSSDGITLDRVAPKAIFRVETSNDTIVYIQDNVIYQSVTDSIAIVGNISDNHEIQSLEWGLGSLPSLADIRQFTHDLTSLTSVASLVPGDSVFVTLNAVDKAGNHKLESSFAVIADTTAPEMIDLECTQFISVRKSIITCSWSTIVENESILKATTISMGSTQADFDILDSFVVHRNTYSFTRDLYNHISQFRNTTFMFITVTVWNVVGHKTIYGREVIVDRTAPLADRLDVLTSTSQGTPVERNQKCQLPRGYVEVKLINVVDEETPIDVNRYEIALGSKPLGTDYLEYHPVVAKSDGIFFVNGFRLNQGDLFFVTMRIYNKAGLSSEFSSDSVVVSQTPFLEVKDGTGEQDIDFQSTPNLIQGSWKYSDACPIGEAKWKIESLAGNILFDFQPIPNAGQMFYNDEVQLENGMKYIVTVQTIDFLDRVKTARSDGVTVRIQPPFPGLVRDGIDKDLTYQFSTTEFSANWDNFGDKSSDPTQSIHHYEVAIGNDRRYEKTRSNVHYFVDVGLNTSYTFSHLNLTSKLARYYVTVRAYSMAGGITEGYSNGIRVGYNDDIIPGSVSVNKYQFSVDSMAISWNGFQSDIDIIDYKVAISSHEDIITNDTVVCNIITANKTMYDISPLRSVGLDEYSKLLGLTLFHNSKYYVTVVAEDEAGMCTGITSDWVLVDTTSPEFGKLYINDIESSTVIYVRKPSEMQIEWEMHDHESGINNVLVQLFECSSCMSKGVTSENCYLVDKTSVKNDTKTAFYELQMSPQNAYYVTVEVTNEANLVTRVQSPSNLVDTTPPLIGELKITDDWHDVETFQHSTDRLSGMLPIALTATDYLCPSQILYFPVSSDIRMKQVMDKYDNEFLVVNNTGAYLGIGYNSDLTDITKSGVISESMNLQNGNYSFNVRVAKGYQTITTVAIVTDQIVIPFVIDNKPEEVEFDYSKFENVTGLEAGNSTQDDYTNITTTTAVPNVSSMPNNSTNGSKSDLESQEYGIGIHLLGYKIGNNKYYHHVFWAKSKYTSSLRWFQTDKDLNSEQSFILRVAKKSEYLDNIVDVTLIVGGEEVVSISGFKFTGAVKLAALTWNEENFKPPLEDIYRPFYSDAVLSSIYVPDMHDKLCRHGRGFFDGESGIKELWIGASDNDVLPGNIRALELYKTFCFPCLKPCDTLCNETCTAEKLLDGFNMINIELTNVHLESSENSTECANITSDKKCNSTAYYLNAKLVNFAGEETLVFSNGIQIDISPPYCEYVKCTSPEYSEDQPTNFTGSSSIIGAYWNCTEKTSQIVKFTVQIINKESGAVVMDNVDVGLKSKATFNLDNGTFQHEKHYDVRVYALNSAGLTSIASCSVQVILFPPDVSKVISGPLYTNRTNTADDQEPYWTESQSQIGIQWQGGTPDIEFYEWRVGTQSDGDDLFPPSKVGVNTTGSFAIVHGKVHYNDKYINRTVSEYRDILNMSTKERNNLTSASEAAKSFYQMEPGRCVHQSLYAIGLSHLKSNIKKETVCIKRAGDVNLKMNAGASTLRALRPVGSVNWMETNDAIAADIVVESELTTGGITLGTVTKQDIQETYGSAATSEYRPFISNVETTQKKTSRLLRNRIHHLCDVNFFLSPAPRAEASRVTIHVTVGPGCEKDPVYQPALVFWDTEKEVWVHIDEGCNEILSANFSSGVYSSMICPDFNNAVRKKRDASIELESPTHYSLVKIGKTFINYPPKIVSKTLDITEDVIADFTLETEDPEDDTLVYNIVDEPENLQCNITSDGNLRCKAIEDDFYGEDDVTVEVTETDLPAFEQPMSHTKQLKLVIHGTPDKTERFFFDSNETFYAEKRPSFRHTILVNANRSSTHYAGRIVLADVDGGEIFFPFPRFSALGDAAFSLKRLTNTSNIPLANYTTRRYRSVQAYDIEFEYSPDLQGNMTLDFIARNADDIYTPGVTIDVYVMENPCIHGQCHHPILGYDACEDPARSRSFSGFECVCEPGYIGDWCQIEIDECQSSSCSSMYDCEDLVNGYQCNINIPKLLAVIVCPLIALIVLVYVIVKLRDIKLSRSSIRRIFVRGARQKYV